MFNTQLGLMHETNKKCFDLKFGVSDPMTASAQSKKRRMIRKVMSMSIDGLRFVNIAQIAVRNKMG